MKVQMRTLFAKHFKNFPQQDRTLIVQFILHLQEHGKTNLVGRWKNSNEVDNDDPNWMDKVTYANKHKLYHYHIGIPQYDKTKGVGQYTSEYMIHFQWYKELDEVWLADYGPHPFAMPTEHYLDVAKEKYETN